MREIAHQDDTTIFVMVLLDIFLFAFEASILLLKVSAPTTAMPNSLLVRT